MALTEQDLVIATDDGTPPGGPSPASAQPQPSAFLFVPAYRGAVSTQTFMGCVQAAQALTANGIGTITGTLDYPGVNDARNIALTLWYDSIPTSHMLTVDNDMGFDPQLPLDMFALGEPLVGTIYRCRDDAINWVGTGFPLPDYFAELRGRHEARGSFIDVDGVGMGITLIRRDVIDRMIASYPQLIRSKVDGHPCYEKYLRPRGITRLLRFFDPIEIEEGVPLSEDLSFCARWKMIGGRVWASIGHETSHVGLKEYRGSYLAQQRDMQQSQANAPITQEAVS